MEICKDKSFRLALEAYQELCKAGIPEQYTTLLVDIARKRRGAFFGSFGNETGCFIEVENTDNVLTPVRISFGIRRCKQSFFSKLSQSFKHILKIFKDQDSEYSIELDSNEITKLKDLLRVL